MAFVAEGTLKPGTFYLVAYAVVAQSSVNAAQLTKVDINSVTAGSWWHILGGRAQKVKVFTVTAYSLSLFLSRKML